jgi:hypothetical protein
MILPVKISLYIWRTHRPVTQFHCSFVRKQKNIGGTMNTVISTSQETNEDDHEEEAGLEAEGSEGQAEGKHREREGKHQQVARKIAPYATVAN